MADVVLRSEGLSKSYGSLLAVKSLTLEVYQGEVFGFLGPNGAGKTTAINMMCGLLKPDSGSVLIHGQPISGGDRNVQARFGVCPQEIVLWGRLTCLEQLQFIGEMYCMSGRTARLRGDELLAQLGLAEKRNAQAHTLSGGMKRRLNLAMALVHDPEIVVLDEPEAGLDPQSRVSVRDYIRSLAHQKTIILTTHNMDEADRVADRVAIIDHGELLVLDTPQALKRSIGAGDVLEIGLADEAAADAARAALAHVPHAGQLSATDSGLIMRAPNAVNLLPGIAQALAAAGVQCGDVRVRETSLEDVFIHLTGRRLRA